MPVQLVSEAVNLGIHALLVLAANPGRRLSTVVIAESLRVSASHLAKVMQRLAVAGLVSSMRGTTGGFVLAQTPEEITVGQIADAIDPVRPFVACLLRMPRCTEGKCPVSQLHASLQEMVREKFSQVHLADFQKNMESFVLPLADGVK